MQRRAGSVSSFGIGEVLLVGCVVWGISAVAPVLLKPTDLKSSTVNGVASDAIMKIHSDSNGRELWVLRGISELVKLDLKSHQSETVYHNRDFSITNVCVSRDSSTHLLTLQNHETLVFRGGEVIAYEQSFDSEPQRCTLSADGNMAICISGGTSVKCWNLAGDEVVAVDFEVPERVETIGVDPAGRKLVISSVSEGVKVYDVLTGNLLQTLISGETVARSLAISPDGRWLATNRCSSLALYDFQTGERIWEEQAVGLDYFGNVTISPDGSRVAMTSRKYGLRILDRENGRILRDFPKVSLGCKVAFAPSSDKFYSGNIDGSIGIWSVSDGQELGHLNAGVSPAKSAH